MRSIGSPRAVSISIGSWRVRGLARSSRQRSRPSPSGSIRSSTSASKRLAPQQRRARRRSEPAVVDVEAGLRRGSRRPSRRGGRRRRSAAGVASWRGHRCERRERLARAARPRPYRRGRSDAAAASCALHRASCAPPSSRLRSLHALAELGALLGRQHAADVEHRLQSCAGSPGRAARASAGAAARRRRRRRSARVKICIALLAQRRGRPRAAPSGRRPRRCMICLIWVRCASLAPRPSSMRSKRWPIIMPGPPIMPAS